MKSKSVKGSAREHILQVAGNLFYQNGIRAIGVDTIVAQAGVAKTTLYDHFASKDDLIKAYLEEQDHNFWQNFESFLQKHPDDPQQQLLDVFEGFEEMINAPESLGCPFLSAASEFPELDQSGHAVALAHKQKLRARLQELAKAAGATKFPQLGEQLLLVLDGAFASRRVFRNELSPTQELKATAAMLLESHLAVAR